MKKTKFLFSLFVLAAFFGAFLFASVTKAQTQNDDLVDAVEKEDLANLEAMQDAIEFSQFRSCMDMESVLGEFLKLFDDEDFRGGPRYYGIEDDMVVMEMAVDAEAPAAAGGDMLKSSSNTMADTEESIQSSSTEYSDTNLQKANVDEPEIIKTNGDEIFYYNREEQKIYIIQSPLDRSNSTIDLDDATVLTEINLPKKLYNPQLFVTGDRLVILASRNVSIADRDSVLNRTNRTSLAIYDISNPSSVNLLKFSDFDGRYRNSRMIDNKLYILSQLDVNRWNLKENNSKVDDKLLPRVFDIDVANEALKIIVPECDNVSYVLPSEETIKQTGLMPVFTIISVVDIDDTDKDTVTNVTLSNAGEIHMSTDSLYIAQNLWMPNRVSCPMGARCIMPRFDDGQHTLIHKFDVDGFDLDYHASNLIPGGLLTQYSMDEHDGNFRILTRKNRSDGTNFYAFDEDMDLKGAIDGIQPGEQFKASRYMGDKLYLVTFERTDPLFVIDVEDISNPEIIGELMIPGFSTYLHPMGELNNEVQYLIGLGYAANERGRQEGLQLSLYEVNYNESETAESRCSRLSGSNFDDDYSSCVKGVSEDNVRVTQMDSITLGGQGSSSEAMENPRMFVMDKDNIVTLPMLLQKQEQAGERCSVFIDSEGVERRDNCYPVEKSVTYFAGLQSFKFDAAKASITNTQKVDYLPLFAKLYASDSEYQNIDSWRIRSLAMRAGFVGDAFYMINNDFANFYVPGHDDDKYIYFDGRLDGDVPTDCAALGEASSSGPVSPEYQWEKQCCEGLESVTPAEAYNEDGDMAIGGGMICANIDDGKCDDQYENQWNSKDCQ